MASHRPPHLPEVIALPISQTAIAIAPLRIPQSDRNNSMFIYQEHKAIFNVLFGG